MYWPFSPTSVSPMEVNENTASTKRKENRTVSRSYKIGLGCYIPASPQKSDIFVQVTSHFKSRFTWNMDTLMVKKKKREIRGFLTKPVKLCIHSQKKVCGGIVRFEKKLLLQTWRKRANAKLLGGMQYF